MEKIDNKPETKEKSAYYDRYEDFLYWLIWHNYVSEKEPEEVELIINCYLGEY